MIVWTEIRSFVTACLGFFLMYGSFKTDDPGLERSLFFVGIMSLIWSDALATHADVRRIRKELES